MPRPENYWDSIFFQLMCSLLMATGICRTSADLGTSSNNRITFQRQLQSWVWTSGCHSLGCDSKPGPRDESFFLSSLPSKHLWVKIPLSPQCCPPHKACSCSGALFVGLMPGLVEVSGHIMLAPTARVAWHVSAFEENQWFGHSQKVPDIYIEVIFRIAFVIVLQLRLSSFKKQCDIQINSMHGNCVLLWLDFCCHK